MAFIARFEQRPIEPKRVHDDVLCGYAFADVGNRRILQLETYGSRERQIPGKVSQSLQLDEERAKALKQIIEHTFPGV